MKEKMLRSFLGAGLCAMMAIWPASAWNKPILLLPFGILGWLIGYHGDRILDGIKIGWNMQYGISTKIWQKYAHYFNAGNLKLFYLAIDLPIILIARVAKVIVICLLAVVTFFTDTIVGVFRLPTITIKWLKKHPANPAIFSKSILSILFMSVCCVGLYKYFSVYGAQPGDIVADVHRKTTVIQTIAGAFLENFFIAFICGSFLTIPVLAFNMDEASSMSGFYGLWERYSKNNFFLFLVKEACRMVLIQIWWVCTLVSLIAYAVIGVAIMVFCGSLLFLTIYTGIRIAWIAVKANKDFGLISLLVGLCVGAYAFFVFQEKMIIDLSLRLVVSVISGICAGGISLFITMIGETLFQKNNWLKKISESKEYFKTLDNHFDLMMTKWGRGFILLWQNVKKVLPRYALVELI